MSSTIHTISTATPESSASKPSTNSLNATSSGVKYDGGKNRLDLIPAYPLWILGEVYTFGASKYADDNWRKGISYKRIFAALMRHAWKWFNGEDIDEESGLPHLAHCAWSCFTLLEYIHTHPELDDRPKGASYNSHQGNRTDRPKEPNGTTSVSNWKSDATGIA